MISEVTNKDAILESHFQVHWIARQANEIPQMLRVRSKNVRNNIWIRIGSKQYNISFQYERSGKDRIEAKPCGCFEMATIIDWRKVKSSSARATKSLYLLSSISNEINVVI